MVGTATTLQMIAAPAPTAVDRLWEVSQLVEVVCVKTALPVYTSTLVVSWVGAGLNTPVDIVDIATTLTAQINPRG